MKKIATILIIMSLAFGGRLGIGISGGGEYTNDYKDISPAEIQNIFYGAELSLQAEALPNVFFETSACYLNNPSEESSTGGLGLGINIQPRIGRIPIAPLLGVKGTLLFRNDLDVNSAVSDGTIAEFIETSTPQLIAAGYAGLNIFLTESVSLNCHYRYQGLASEYTAEMVWVGFAYYISW